MIRALILVIVVALAGLVLLSFEGGGLKALFGEQGGALTADAQELAALAASLALIVIVLPAVFGGYRGRVGGAIRDLVSWTAIALVLMAGYSYRDELGRIAFRIAG
jgi:predicted aspartyl protease